MYKEGLDSTFTHNNELYYVDSLLECSTGIDSTVIDVNQLTWILQYTQTDPDRIVSADCSIPIIVLSTEQWGLVVLDGAHRLTSVLNKGSTTIKCKVLTEIQLSTVQKVK